MKIILKNLKQVKYEVELETEKNTIKDLKKEIEKLHGFDANLIKLLHNGKVLEDHKTLEDYKIKEENVIVMMNIKPKKRIETESSEQVKPPPTKKEEPSKKEEEKPKTYNAEQVNKLIEMGYGSEKVEKALNAANGNMQLAIEFLTSGKIPEQSTYNQSNEQYRQYNDSGSRLPELRVYASFIKMKCSNQPEKILSILDTLEQKNPSLLGFIRDYEEEFKRLLVAPITQEDIINYKRIEEEGGGRRRQIKINLTPEEREAINRLKNLGDFSESDIIQAYIACDKNEELAANYLFEQKLREEEEQNNNLGQ